MIQLYDRDAAEVVDILTRVANFFEGYSRGTNLTTIRAYDALMLWDADGLKDASARYTSIVAAIREQREAGALLLGHLGGREVHGDARRWEREAAVADGGADTPLEAPGWPRSVKPGDALKTRQAEVL